MKEKKEDSFNFSDEVVEKIKKSFDEFVQKSSRVGKKFPKINDEQMGYIVSATLESFIEKALKNAEIENEKPFSSEEKKYFRKRIREIVFNSGEIK